MTKRPLPLAHVYRLIEPGPVTLVTTFHEGRANIMTMSWHTMMEFVPPLVGCIISDRNFTFKGLKATKECAINIPSAELAPEVVGCGNVSGSTVDKFWKFHLTPVRASKIHSPLIQECFANLECKVVDMTMVKKYNFFVLKVLKAWIDPTRMNARTIHHRGMGLFMVAGRDIKLPSKML